jgi:hypothetical protein
VLDQQYGHPIPADAFDEQPQGLGFGAVHARGRLVECQQLRFGGQARAISRRR